MNIESVSYVLEQIYWILILTWKSLYPLIPYVITGIILSELLKYTSWIDLMIRYSGKSHLVTIIVAIILGMLSPLCTYGTIPLIIVLLQNRFPLSPAIIFLSVSSLMNPQLFVITWGGISLEMAIVRIITVVFIGVILGLFLCLVNEKYIVKSKLRERKLEHEGNDVLIRRFRWKHFLRGLLKNAQFVGFYIIVGVFLGVVVELYIPGEWITSIFNQEGWYSVLMAALLGVPFYICGGGTIPLVNSLLIQGMSQGAALAFLSTGQAIRITPLIALSSILKTRFIVQYCLIIIAFSLFAGIVYHLLS